MENALSASSLIGVNQAAFDATQQAAARHRTSFSCPGSRIRFFRLRFSADFALVTPGFSPSSTAARRIHFDNVISWSGRQPKTQGLRPPEIRRFGVAAGPPLPPVRVGSRAHNG
jgi:hypothetical protein